MSNTYIGESVEKDEFIERLLQQISEGVEGTRKEFEEKMTSDTLDGRYHHLKANMEILTDYCNLVYNLANGRYYG